MNKRDGESAGGRLKMVANDFLNPTHDGEHVQQVHVLDKNGLPGLRGRSRVFKDPTQLLFNPGDKRIAEGPCKVAN